MKVLAAIILVVMAATASEGAHCVAVDCSSYKFTITPHDNGYQECRFKLRHDNPDLANKFGSGLQVHGYADLTLPESVIQKPTQDCPKEGKQRYTESPKPSDGDIYPGDTAYYECCVPKVLNFCYYKVSAQFHCHQWSPMPTDPKQNDREDDVVQKLFVTYRNRAAKKEVNVTFFPKLAKVTCTNNFGAPDQVFYKGLGKTGVKQCGDKDISVKLHRYRATYESGYKYTILKVQRYQCNSQYTAMFTDPSGREKFTMRTQVDPAKRSDAVDGAAIGPVLAQTFAGKCGKLVKSVS